ncbi:diphosphomevalonate decarboxylase [Trichodelitschia bisporula]|uniref:Diphosphomevalonate decarboxylase n=1 Tax=Trichodelitschia bisporula TaxID=703511 RepID=A0A6G1HT74_9PEZI|nr:diphosphomevalonate decarboxylase [Trichodelitschia bisporula]
MADTKIYRASTTAPVNIAVIKYWGKRDVTLNLPTNSSLSVTLSQSDLRTHTTASCSSTFTSDTLHLNSAPQDITGARLQACLRALRSLRAAHEASNPSLPPLSTLPLRLASRNNFPTAAGLASSAAGFAALVRAIADLYELPSSPTELSLIARQGSGSACRSLFGGYVAWNAGTATDGSDSSAELVAEAAHWPDMRAAILVASAKKKAVSSTAGMQATVKTSSLFPHRAETVVPARMAAMRAAIAGRDFAAFADLTMKDSNSFHAVCLDTTPPIFYMSDVSRAAVRVVEGINAAAAADGITRPVAAYTFDAGPNAVVYYLAEDEARVAGAFKALLGSVEGWETARGAVVQAADVARVVAYDEGAAETLAGGIQRVILTGVGEGPISVSEHLVNEAGEVILE